MNSCDKTLLRHTRSVCPICLKPIPARLVQDQGTVLMEKNCSQHGTFSVPIWRNYIDLETWRGTIPETEKFPDCPQGCESGICPEHQQGSCCVLLEVTRRCNLHCAYCFADGALPEPALDELKRAVSCIYEKGKAPLLQLSGGEPTLRDDLPELVAYAHSLGFPYIQLNTNGLRLAKDEAYVRALAEAGLSFVFMQFDGVTDDVFLTLRGAPLLEQKKRAIEHCDRCGLGVTLVPTVVRGVNDGQIGDLVRLGAELSPAVRGIHFQPVSYFGRIPEQPDDSQRYTLDELINSLTVQAGIPASCLEPSHCDHPLCGLHATFIVMQDRSLRPLRAVSSGCCGQTDARQNREYVGRHWKRETCSCCGESADISTLDGFLSRSKTFSFTITAMAFQDAMNLDIERLRRCSLHVYEKGVLMPFCARYLTPISTEPE